jgi:hypothetical protein
VADVEQAIQAVGHPGRLVGPPLDQPKTLGLGLSTLAAVQQGVVRSVSTPDEQMGAR